jgi:hypothetical protein
MGIKYLNRFLRDNCTKKAISKKPLSAFRNKTVVIDTSIYLYKFASEDLLMENMYLMISILKSYKIIPIFIFDGKPPIEKRDLLKQRRLEKKEAEQKFTILQNTLENACAEDSKDIVKEMESLKRQMIRIRDDDIQKVKHLMDAYGVIYYDAIGEADRLCAYLLRIGKAWACMSDDMDMFLYGCPFVMRSLSLMNKTVILYDTEAILKDLEMTQQQFCEIMVLSGTDYNIHSKTSLNETIKWYYQYMKYYANTEHPYGFYVWLVKHTNYITDYKKLLMVYQLFQFNNHNDDYELEQWKLVEIVEKPVNQPELESIMEKEGFIFLKGT